ncbi:MAG: dehydrogenase [Verrucomicrobiales bacterium]|nr:dehydrogenase [Verrucomicrobiales bacterium]
MNTKVPEPAAKTRVLILGGGFGGLYAALHLDKTIATDPNVEVTLVSRENFILFTPMLHEVASGELDLTDIVSPLRRTLKHVTFLEADVEAIDLVERRVTITYGLQRQQKKLSYDHLLIALGSETNFFKLPGVEERSLTMKSLRDAFVLRNQMLGLLELASLAEEASVRRAMLTFVVAGGGFAGVETIGALSDFVREAMKYYPTLMEADLRVVLVHPGSVILPELGESLGRYAQGKLATRKVEIRAETRVTGFSERGVELENGEAIATQTLVWTAGVTPPAVLQSLPCKREKGRIVVEQTLEVPGFPGVWAVGDCAWIPNPKAGNTHPPTAQHALREAVHCAKNLVATIHGKQKRTFTFATLGQLATIGRRTGVANIMGFHFSGLFAWFLWRTIYLAKLPRFEKKLRVALQWTLDLLFPEDLVQYPPRRVISAGGNR